jgi:hypothetical protein
MFLTPKSKKVEDKLALQNQVLMIHVVVAHTMHGAPIK